MNSFDLAKGTRSNSSFVRKLVVSLANAGLVESIRGKSGGVRLALPPSEITLDRVYRAVVDSKAICVPKKPAYKPCPVSCAMGGLLSELSSEVETSIYKELSRKKLSDLVERITRPIKSTT